MVKWIYYWLGDWLTNILLIFIRSFIKGFGNLWDEYNRQIFLCADFSYDFISFLYNYLPFLSNFADEIFHFTISDAGHWLAVQMRELSKNLVYHQRANEYDAFLKTFTEFCVHLLDLFSAGASNHKNVHLNFTAAKVNVSCNVAERPPGRPDLGAQPTSCWHPFVMYELLS